MIVLLTQVDVALAFVLSMFHHHAIMFCSFELSGASKHQWDNRWYDEMKGKDVADSFV